MWQYDGLVKLAQWSQMVQYHAEIAHPRTGNELQRLAEARSAKCAFKLRFDLISICILFASIEVYDHLAGVTVWTTTSRSCAFVANISVVIIVLRFDPDNMKNFEG
jgi:hypothetical protein